MSVEMITKENLQIFRLELIKDIKELLTPKTSAAKQWLKSSEVRKILKISAGTLQNLRIKGKLRSSKIGGIHFYSSADIEAMLETGSKAPVVK